MIDLCLTIDVESSDRRYDASGRPLHLAFDRDVARPVTRLELIARRHGVAFTFFYPLAELAPSDRRAADIARRLAAAGHELGVHLHSPFPLWTADEIAETIGHEREALERTTGTSITAVRAGGYNTGERHDSWIDGVARAGLRVDSSVWPGASTAHTARLSRIVRTYEQLWGEGAYAYDYRGAPVAGAWRADPHDLRVRGAGPIVEAPIAALFHDTSDPGAFVLDPQTMTFDVLARSIETIAARAPGRTAAVILVHSNVVGGSLLTAVCRRLDRLIAWCVERGARFVSLAELGDWCEDYGPVYAPDQPEPWLTADRSSLVSLLTRCPSCGADLSASRCSECGWFVQAVAPGMLDARVERVEASPAREPSRGARRLRAALALTGGILAAGWGMFLYALARTRRR